MLLWPGNSQLWEADFPANRQNILCNAALIPGQRYRWTYDGQEEKAMNSNPGVNSFLPFAHAIMEHEGIPSVLEIVSSALGRDCAFRNSVGGKSFISSSSPTFVESAKTFPFQELRRLFLNKEVAIGNVKPGILFLDLPPDSADLLTHEESVVFENGAVAVALCLEKAFSSLSSESHEKKEGIKDLLYNRCNGISEIKAITKSWKWTDDASAAVLVLSLAENSLFSERERHAFFTLSGNKISSFFPRSVFTVLSNHIVFIIPFPSNERNVPERFSSTLKEISVILQTEISGQLNPSFILAAGGIKNNLFSLSKSYEEALLTLRTSDFTGSKNAVLIWDEMRGMSLVALLSEREEALYFCGRVLGDLLNSNDSFSDALLETLMVMDKSNWNVRTSSEVLKFHYNTVKYRMGIIKERIGFDYSDPEHRFDMSLALRLYPLLRKKTHNQKQSLY